MTFNIHDEINRVNRMHAEIMGYPVPPALLPSGQSPDIPLSASEIPRSLLKANQPRPRKRLFMGVTEPDDERADDQRKGQGSEINRR